VEVDDEVVEAEEEVEETVHVSDVDTVDEEVVGLLDVVVVVGVELEVVVLVLVKEEVLDEVVVLAELELVTGTEEVLVVELGVNDAVVVEEVSGVVVDDVVGREEELVVAIDEVEDVELLVVDLPEVATYNVPMPATTMSITTTTIIIARAMPFLLVCNYIMLDGRCI
jgi:hypothetical protein